MKSTCNGINKLLFLKESPNIAPSTIFDNGQSFTEAQNIANAFNKFFGNVASDIQFYIYYSKNLLHDFLPPINIVFLLNPCDEIEVKNTIIYFNPSTAVGLNSILTKIIKLLIKYVSS